MRIMTLQTGFIGRTNSLMYGSKSCFGEIMTSGAEQTIFFNNNSLIFGGMGLVADQAILCRRIMRHTFLPILGNPLMAAEAKSRLFLGKIFLVCGAMGHMAGRAIEIFNRSMQHRVVIDHFFHSPMTGKTLLAGIFFLAVNIISCMGRVTFRALFFSKRGMSNDILILFFQNLMTGKTKLAAGLTFL